MRSFLSLTLLLCTIAVRGGGVALAADLDPATRAAVVRVEVAVDPACGGTSLMRDLATRDHLSTYEKELLRRLKVGAVGTGFFVNRDGYVITNAHVVLSGVRYRNLKFAPSEWDSLSTTLCTYRQVWVTVGEGSNSRDYLAAPVAVAENLDLALLKVAMPPATEAAFSPLSIASSRRLSVGDPVTSLGFPNYEFQDSSGRVLSLIQGRQVHEEMQLTERTDPATHRKVTTVSGTSDGPVMRFQHDAPTGHGSSGGPLLDGDGHVVGVAYALLAETAPDGNPEARTDLNLGIASDVLIRFLKENHVTYTEAGR